MIIKWYINHWYLILKIIHFSFSELKFNKNYKECKEQHVRDASGNSFVALNFLVNRIAVLANRPVIITIVAIITHSSTATNFKEVTLTGRFSATLKAWDMNKSFLLLISTVLIGIGGFFWLIVRSKRNASIDHWIDLNIRQLWCFLILMLWLLRFLDS